MKNTKNQKTLLPSERKAVTEFSEFYGGNEDFKHRQRRRKIIRTVMTAVVIVALVFLGYFLTETLINITEIPV